VQRTKIYNTTKNIENKKIERKRKHQKQIEKEQKE
jgi:hypothetical protein